MKLFKHLRTGTADNVNEVRDVIRCLDLATDALKASEQFMENGLCEMSAFMGINGKKREVMITEILGNYKAFIKSRMNLMKDLGGL